MMKRLLSLCVALVVTIGLWADIPIINPATAKLPKTPHHFAAKLNTASVITANKIKRAANGRTAGSQPLQYDATTSKTVSHTSSDATITVIGDYISSYSTAIVQIESNNDIAELYLYLTSLSANGNIPDGTYTIGNNNIGGAQASTGYDANDGPYPCYYATFSGSSYTNLWFMVSGTITVSNNGTKFVINARNSNNVSINYTYTGTTGGGTTGNQSLQYDATTSKTVSHTNTDATITVTGDYVSSHNIAIVDIQSNNDIVQLFIFLSSLSANGNIPDGTYTIGSTNIGGALPSTGYDANDGPRPCYYATYSGSSYTNFWFMVSGTITVSNNGTKFVINAKNSNNVSINYTYTYNSNSVITYTATAKLTETTSTYSFGLHTNAFGVSISSHTFANGVGTITFNGDVTRIRDHAFWRCSMTSITIPNSVTEIGEEAFEGCSDLTSITIPNNVTSIGVSAFSGCSGLTSATIGNSVTSIGNGAFVSCSGLTSITIPNSVTSIGDYAFSGCSGLTSIMVENQNINYDSRGGSNAIIETKTNTLIAGCANTTIPNSVTSIGVSAFSGCTGLTSIIIPNSVTSIGKEAFSGSGLTSVVLPNSVTGIGYEAFFGCKNLTSITISNGVTSIGSSAFANTGLTSITIPNSVTSIGSFAFGYCRSLRNITLSNSLTEIERETFNNCTSLTSITIPNSVTSIGVEAFYQCTSLTSLTIPDNVTTVLSDFVAGCSSLQTLTIGNSVRTFCNSADNFSYCVALTNIYCKPTVPPITNDRCFNDTMERNATLHVPSSAVSSYQVAIGWRNFYNIVGDYIGGGTALENVSTVSDSQKIIENNQVLILRNGKRYTLQGVEVQ